jgi:hypothetical protein
MTSPKWPLQGISGTVAAEMRCIHNPAMK